jgi:hypothetical protein
LKVLHSHPSHFVLKIKFHALFFSDSRPRNFFAKVRDPGPETAGSIQEYWPRH